MASSLRPCSSYGWERSLVQHLSCEAKAPKAQIMARLLLSKSVGSILLRCSPNRSSTLRSIQPGPARVQAIDYPSYSSASRNENFEGSQELNNNADRDYDPEKPPNTVPFDPEKVNCIYLTGILGQDPKIQFLDTGKVLTTVSLAVSRGPSSDASTESTDWFNLELWGDLAESLAYHLKKGARVQVMGRAKMVQWVDKQTEAKRSSLKITVKEFNTINSDRATSSRDAYKPSGVSGGDRKALVEGLWRSLFQSPSEFFDNRLNKRNPKAPDFKHKETGDALWLDSWTTPAWVKDKIGSLQNEGAPSQIVPDGASRDLGPTGSFPGSFIDKKAATEKLWQELFASPDLFMDCRASKRNPKAPDFKHRSTGDALWLDSWSTPAWVKDRVAELEDGRETIQPLPMPSWSGPGLARGKGRGRQDDVEPDSFDQVF